MTDEATTRNPEAPPERGRRSWINLEVTEVSRGEKDWTVTAAAVVRNYDDATRVQFILDGKDSGEPVAVDDGRATKTFAGVKSGERKLGAKLAGRKDVKTFQTLNLKEVVKRPARLIIHKIGSGKTRDLHFQVLAEDNSPIPGAVIRILDPNSTPNLTEVTSGADGTVSHQVKLNGERHELTVLVAGSDLQENICLWNREGGKDEAVSNL